MKLIFKTKHEKKGKPHSKTYLVKLPNYFNTDRLPELLRDIATNYLGNEEITEHQLMGDSSLTNDERKQLDIHGKVIDAPVELKCDNLVKRV